MTVVPRRGELSGVVLVPFVGVGVGRPIPASAPVVIGRCCIKMWQIAEIGFEGEWLGNVICLDSTAEDTDGSG